MTANYSHQTKLFDPRRQRPVTLIGAGSVGSHVAYTLAKMGVEDLRVIDHDTVASHNVPMSLYRAQDLARPKVEALVELLAYLAGITIRAEHAMYEGDHELSRSTVVSCVDSMETRKRIWERVKRDPTIDLFIDTRTAGAYVQVFSIDPNQREDIEAYEPFLFSDAEAARHYCGQHGVAFSVMRAATIVAANIASFWTDRTKQWHVAELCDTLVRVI